MNGKISESQPTCDGESVHIIDEVDEAQDGHGDPFRTRNCPGRAQTGRRGAIIRVAVALVAAHELLVRAVGRDPFRLHLEDLQRVPSVQGILLSGHDSSSASKHRLANNRPGSFLQVWNNPASGAFRRARGERRRMKIGVAYQRRRGTRPAGAHTHHYFSTTKGRSNRTGTSSV
jgi:hypothetical protein